MVPLLSGLAVYGFDIAVCLAIALPPRSTPSLERAAQKYARRVGLGISDQARSLVLRRLERQRRTAGVGGAAGIALVVGAIAALSGGSWSTQVSWLSIGAIYSAGAVGNAAALMLRPDSRDDGVRIARGTAIDLADYVPRFERVAARVAALIGLAAAAVATVTRGVEPFPLVAAGCILVGVLLFDVGGRRIVRRPQPAGNADELAWDDAFRSANLRAMATAPLLCGLYATAAVAMSYSPLAGSLFLMIASIGALVVAIMNTSPSRQTYYLRRLWPHTAAASA